MCRAESGNNAVRGRLPEQAYFTGRYYTSAFSPNDKTGSIRISHRPVRHVRWRIAPAPRPRPVTAQVNVLGHQVLPNPIHHVRLLHYSACAARCCSPRPRCRLSRLSPCVPAPPRCGWWPLAILDGSSLGNEIVVCFLRSGMVTTCMAVASCTVGYNDSIAAEETA